MAKLSVFLILSAAVALASPCRDPRLRSATVTSDVIHGTVTKDRTPVRHVQVRLYSSGKSVRAGRTGENGGLMIDHLSPGKYQLSIARQGRVPVDVIPEKPRGSRFYDFLMLDLRDGEICVSTVSVTN
jgi:hypothetical protein